MKAVGLRDHACVLALALCFSAHAAFAQEERTDLVVRLDGDAQAWREGDEPIRLLLSRSVSPGEGRLAILVGSMDLTDLFEWRDQALVYRPQSLPLPAGESELSVFLVTPEGQWRESARFPLRVLTESGFREADFAPQVDLQGTRVVHERFDPWGSGVPREDDASMNLVLNGMLAGDGWRFSSRFHTIGVGEREKALRYSERGEDAPLVDLADYSLRVEHADEQRAYAELGHVSQGRHRHLMPGFSSRGLILGAPLGAAGSARFSVLSGSSIVGWNNFTGMERSDHRIVAAGLGWELLPTRPGAVRLDLDYVDGSLLPRTGFNAGSITDAETSQSWGARLSGATPSGRLRFDTGYARSRFRNPFDPLLAFDLDLVAVQEEERGARYLDLSWDLLPTRFIGRHAASLSLALRHERVDPQYRTVTAWVQSDIDQNMIEMNGLLGPLQLQMAYTRAEDNLDDLPSVLKTKTRRSAAGANLALADLFGTSNRFTAWLPVLSYSFDRIHQFGAGVPVDSGFNASHVPDQVGEHHGVGLGWQGAWWQFGWRSDFTEQDNRQPGRESADFEHRMHAANVSLMLHQSVDVSFEVSRERSVSLESARIDRNRNYAFGLAWSLTRKLYLSGTVALTESFDEPRTSSGESTNLDLNLAYRFEWRTGAERGLAGQLFLRYSDIDFSSRDRLFGFDFDNRSRVVIGGINVSMK